MAAKNLNQVPLGIEFFSTPSGPNPYDPPEALEVTPPKVTVIPAIDRAGQEARMAEATGEMPHVGRKPTRYIMDPPAVEAAGTVRVGGQDIAMEHIAIAGARKRTKSPGR